MSEGRKVKIRFRQVVYTKPQYGRFDEYQVVQGRKILSRHDLESQAVKWCDERGYEVAGRP